MQELEYGCAGCRAAKQMSTSKVRTAQYMGLQLKCEAVRVLSVIPRPKLQTSRTMQFVWPGSHPVHHILL